ncbi:MAG: hypothetical protein U5K56_07195 [Halioglobus sp.]|nr:hypothetical protein [Halioglobus sp.]
MTRTESSAPRASISAAIANQPALSKALTGGWSRIISAMPFSMLVLNGLAIVLVCRWSVAVH